MLTEEKLKALAPGIFAAGTIENSPDGCYMTSGGGTLRWVAVRGNGMHDWAIYVGWDGSADDEELAKIGDKVRTKRFVQRMVPCDDMAWALYRL